jgi:uncharacterized Zn ribbon protein
MTDIWKMICPYCEHDKIYRDGDFLRCDHCGYRWQEFREGDYECGGTTVGGCDHVMA